MERQSRILAIAKSRKDGEGGNEKERLYVVRDGMVIQPMRRLLNLVSFSSSVSFHVAIACKVL